MYTMNIYTCQLKRAGNTAIPAASVGADRQKRYGFGNRRKLQLYGSNVE